MVVVMRMMILMIILVTMMISIVQYHVNLTALSLVVVLLWKGMFYRLDLFLFSSPIFYNFHFGFYISIVFSFQFCFIFLLLIFDM